MQDREQNNPVTASGLLAPPSAAVEKRFLRFLVALAFSAVHFAASLVAVVFSFGAVMERFDMAEPTPYSLFERMVSVAADVLFFPASLWPFPLPGASDGFLFIFNSLCWGFCLGRVWRWSRAGMSRVVSAGHAGS